MCFAKLDDVERTSLSQGGQRRKKANIRGVRIDTVEKFRGAGARTDEGIGNEDAVPE